MRNLLRALLIVTTALTAAAVQADAQSRRVHHTSSLLPDGNLLIVGGRNDVGTVLQTAEIFPSQRDGPTVAAAAMIFSRSSHTATVLPDGRVLVAGGIDNGGTYLNNAEVYNPVTNSWLTVNFPGGAPGRHSHTATLLPSGRVLIAGGQDSAGTLTGSCILFRPGPGFDDFVSVTALQQPRGGHTATLLYNGKVFVAGGYLFPGPDYSVSTELYDYAANVWTPGPSLITKRAYHSATGLGNRNVLIAGGYNARNTKETQGILETTEIYNPISDSISPGQPMQERKMLHTAELDPSGVVTLFGGLGNVTTYYYKTTYNFENPSTLIDTVLALSTGIISTASNLNVVLQPQLAVAANGSIVDGDIFISSPTATLEDGKVYFSTRTTRFSINGYPVVNGRVNYYGDPVPMTNPSGTIIFDARNAGTPDTPSGAGSTLVIAAGAGCAGNSTCDISGGTLRLGSIDVAFPMTDYVPPSSTILTGQARIITANITESGSDTIGAYALSLTSGTCDLTGGSVVPTTDLTGAHINMANRDFLGVRGSIVISTTTARASPVLPVSLTVSGVTLRLQYIVSPVNLAGIGFDYDIATVTIRRMIFGDVEHYDPSKNTMAFGAAGAPRYNHTSVLTPNGDEAFFGGQTCGDATCSAFLTLRTDTPGALIPVPASDTPWQTLASANMLASRSHHTTTVLPDGRLLAAGGTNGTVVLNAAELYDPQTGVWAATGGMRYPRNLHTATLLPNGRVLAAGGFISIGSTGATRSAELFFPETGTWVPTSQMVSSRSYHTSVLLPDGNVLVAGGYDASGNYLNTAEIYITTAMVWRPIPSMSVARGQHTMSLQQNGKVLVAGGVNSTVRGEVEEYNPTTGLWTLRTSLSQSRYAHSATLLRDGRLLVTGGSDGYGEIAAAEIYNPVTNAWAYTTSFGGGNGNDMLVPRLRHNATLLPDGKVLVTGGIDRLGQPVIDTEGFDVDHSTWQLQGKLAAARAYHSTLLAHNGMVVLVGGFTGLDRLNSVEYRYYAPGTIDQASPPPSLRQPTIVSIDTMTFVQGTSITLRGTHFQGNGEASGGRGNAQSSHHLPRVYIQRMDGSGNNTQSDSGFVVDLTTRVYDPAYNAWSIMDSSITLQIPTSTGLAPRGWYQIRVAANAQFSDAMSIQIGPPRPSASPGIPSGIVLGVSSISWTWNAAGGSFDGYIVYSATNGVFIATAPTNVFIQRNLGPDTVAAIKVAAFNISGDGPVITSSVPYTTPSGDITGLSGAPQSPTSILWSWSNNSAASSYNVFATTSGTRIATVGTPSFLMSGISTNTAYGLQIQAITDTGNGLLSPGVTVYTYAAAPGAGIPALNYVSTGGFLATWQANQNPTGTTFNLKILPDGTGAAVAITDITDLTRGLTVDNAAMVPNTLYHVSVAAVNGDGIESAYTALGSTCTLANPAASPTVAFTDPASIGVVWGANSNSSTTTWQIVVSSDNFVNHYSTPIAYSSSYTALSATLSGLLTGLTYDIRIYARNQYGAETAFVSTRAFTDNGGGPVGSLAILAPKNAMTVMSGNIGSGRKIFVRVPPNTFSEDVRLFISSYSVLNCGNINAAVVVTPIPYLQAKGPFELGISYNTGEANLGSVATLGMVRYDETSRACVPLQSRVDDASRLVTAQLNHLSIYQLAQLSPSSTIETARVFPNPLYKNSQSYFTFDRLPAGSRVRVFTLHGEELFDRTANASGLLTWDAANKSGRPVASGLYLAVIEANGNRRTLKIAVVR
ncbi:MAG: kelch repeat-containing protein [Elusimicrobiota bacterium]|jgi:N-acetylneuraminic acid mutarotase